MPAACRHHVQVRGGSSTHSAAWTNHDDDTSTPLEINGLCLTTHSRSRLSCDFLKERPAGYQGGHVERLTSRPVKICGHGRCHLRSCVEH
ncbi:hypothetical protein DPEC_G00292220 [Dallia pectoralis]|uniref:Uncharacterized protein n=1 Tax=Dallia pectoralis TaxID=75939 RepID=A0ACC2FHN2_DALPE|nr:hypothetical protein DPEC_G00292220 [Dallia pectoralis]